MGMFLKDMKGGMMSRSYTRVTLGEEILARQTETSYPAK